MELSFEHCKIEEIIEGEMTKCDDCGEETPVTYSTMHSGGKLVMRERNKNQKCDYCLDRLLYP